MDQDDIRRAERKVAERMLDSQPVTQERLQEIADTVAKDICGDRARAADVELTHDGQLRFRVVAPLETIRMRIAKERLE